MKKVDHTNETNTANNGMNMTIITYRNYGDIDVQFDDGAIRKGVNYQQFESGSVRHPKDMKRLGQTALNYNKEMMIIVEYINAHNIIVEFNDDFHTRVKTTYQNFKNGNVKKPVSRIGETFVANNGMKITIIAYRSSKDIDVQFEDGRIAEGKTYQQFKRGEVRHPMISKQISNLKEYRTGLGIKAKNELKMVIIAYRSYNDIDIQFADGVIKKGISFWQFKTRQVGHPTLKIKGKGSLGTFNTFGSFVNPDGERYYRCECKKCGKKANLTPEEMLTHIC